VEKKTDCLRFRRAGSIAAVAALLDVALLRELFRSRRDFSVEPEAGYPLVERAGMFIGEGIEEHSNFSCMQHWASRSTGENAASRHMMRELECRCCPVGRPKRGAQEGNEYCARQALGSHQAPGPASDQLSPQGGRKQLAPARLGGGVCGEGAPGSVNLPPGPA
jgi:hypothetical protein